MPKIGILAQNSIRRLISRDYQLLKGKGGYRAVGKLWGVSSGLAWDMVNVDNYWPKDKEIQRIIIEKAKQRGIEFNTNGRKRRRVEIDPEINDDQLKVIRKLSVVERTRILIKAIKGDKNV